MVTGFRGTFVISWTQTELDGLSAAPLGNLSNGAQWRWHGRATRVDGPGDVLVLGHTEETDRLRRHAARTVQRLVFAALQKSGARKIEDADDPLMDNGFTVTDGIRTYTATIIDVPERDLCLLMFLNDVPPEGMDLWVTHVADQSVHANRSGDRTPHVICFTPDTMVETPIGQKRVGDLREDDRVLTKDDGPQPVRWIGSRRISGARFVAMPELRPIRIKSGALGEERPDSDLLVSPHHRMLLQGDQARRLFGENEVLVAAKDLVNDHSIMRDRQITEITYVHLLLDRHQILFANGLESESFHPACMPIDAVSPEQRPSLLDRVPGLDQNNGAYGAFARRMLTGAEAAILQYGRFRAH